MALLARALAVSPRFWKVEGGLFTYIGRIVSDCGQVVLRAVWRIAFFCRWLYACGWAVSWDPWTAEEKSTPWNDDDVLLIGPYLYTAIVKVGPGYSLNGRLQRQMITEAVWVFASLPEDSEWRRFDLSTTYIAQFLRDCSEA